jgi:hypothetical protein
MPRQAASRSRSSGDSNGESVMLGRAGWRTAASDSPSEPIGK